MKMIRQSAFETNSSSCHSVTIASTGVYVGITPDGTGDIELSPMEFGWEQESYSDVYTKMTYLWIYIKDWCENPVGKSDRFMEMFQRVVQEHTGCKEVVMLQTDSDECYPYEYIDHQSVEDSEYDYLFENEQTLKDFLFNPNSVLTTDNDNH